MARWAVSRVTAVPTVSDGDADDPLWYPLQHAFGIDTFGVNLFVASRADQTLVEEHDESASGQQELYVVLEGEAVFNLDDQQAHLDRGTALAVTDPDVRRSAKAMTSGTALLVVGASGEPFKSTWNPDHFSDIRRPD
jgi:mannose-6-phosphate isomerase-like protein (cupin superfamily)